MQAAPAVRNAGRIQVALALAGLAVTLALLLAALGAERAHRAAAERVLRDYAGVAGTEFVRRTAFDIGFNGYETIASALRRSASVGEPALPERLPAQARALVAHLFVVEHGVPRQLSGEPAPLQLAWVATEAAAPPRENDGVSTRHRVSQGRAETLVLVPLDDAAGRLAVFDVDPAGLRPFFERGLARGPLLPVVIGDGHLTNDALALRVHDAAGATRLQAGAGVWPEWEVAVPFGDFFRGVLAGSQVRIALDPALAERLLPGGLPRSRLPLLAALGLFSLALTLGALAQARRERALVRLRDDFVASVSHELRTPLAQIRLFTETLLLGRCRSAADERLCLESVQREALRLGALVDNILDFSRAERGALDVALSPQRLAPVVGEVVAAFAPLAGSRGVRLATELDPQVGAAVDADGFRRVLLNLLDNAVKYGPAQGEVTLRLTRAGPQVEVAVEDRGPGVPAAAREAIFTPYHRLTRDRQQAAAGAGIGLAVVRELVSRHGGSCRVEERAGGGARFVVSLPAVEGTA